MLALIDCSRPADASCPPSFGSRGSVMSRPLLVLVESASSDATERSRHTAENLAARMKRGDRGHNPIAAQLRAQGRRVMIHVRRGAPVPEILAAA
jgi:hypothetical protein